MLFDSIGRRTDDGLAIYDITELKIGLGGGLLPILFLLALSRSRTDHPRRHRALPIRLRVLCVPSTL